MRNVPSMTSKKGLIRNDPLAWVDDDESRVDASVTDEDGPVTTETDGPGRGAAR